MKYEITELPGGTRVVAAPLRERRSVSIGIWVHAGGRDEEPRIGGVSHFLEHAVFKGTPTRTANQIKEAVEGIGGSLNAFTSEEYTCFLAKTSAKHYEGVFDVLSDMVLNASLKEGDIEKERTVIMEEIKMTQDQPSQLVDEILAELTWPGHALGRPLAGTAESVRGLSREDIRSYKERFYRPGHVTVVAAGAIDQDTLVKSAASRFKNSGASAAKDVKLFSESQTKPRFKITSKPTEQTHISLGLRTFRKDHPDEYALDILNVLLGGNMSSRLFNEVREERGLAYEIGSSVRKYHETGAFAVEAGVDNKKAIEALRVILSELAKTARDAVKPDELTRAKEFYLGQMDLGLESSMSHMIWVGESAVCLGRCRTYEEVAAGVDRVTAGDLRRVAGDIFKTRALNLAVIGPKAADLEGEFSKVLSF